MVGIQHLRANLLRVGQQSVRYSHTVVVPQEFVKRVPPAPRRPITAHKGTFGTVVVIGGQQTMLGAPAISATAALRCGVGLCKIMTDMQILPHVLTIQPSATGLPLNEDTSIDALEKSDPRHRSILAIGPGFGTDPARKFIIDELVCKPSAWGIVLDADGLNILAASGKTLSNSRTEASGPLVLTPHPGEFRRLAAPLGIEDSPVKESERVAAAEKLANAHSAVVVLKGDKTVVTDGKQCFVNDIVPGAPCLATAGSGDVLTGIIAALIAQGMSPFNAAVLGVIVHVEAAHAWMKANGDAGMLALDLCQLLPKVLRAHRD